MKLRNTTECKDLMRVQLQDGRRRVEDSVSESTFSALREQAGFSPSQGYIS